MIAVKMNKYHYYERWNFMIKFKKDEQGIYYIHDYFPKNKYGEDRNEFSQNIYGIKNGYESICSKYYMDLVECLTKQVSDKIQLLKDKPICIVPSSQSRKWGEGLEYIVRNLVKDFSMIDASRCLVRIQDHDKLSLGGVRDISTHITTIKVFEEELIKGKEVFLFDDITTTGNSLKACEILLLQKGAKKVIKIVLGKTIEEKNKLNPIDDEIINTNSFSIFNDKGYREYQRDYTKNLLKGLNKKLIIHSKKNGNLVAIFILKNIRTQEKERVYLSEYSEYQEKKGIKRINDSSIAEKLQCTKTGQKISIHGEEYVLVLVYYSKNGEE